MAFRLGLLAAGLLLCGCFSSGGRVTPPYRGQSPNPAPLPGPPLEPLPPPSPIRPVSASDAADLSPYKRIAQRASERDAALGAYIVRIRRREQINGKDQPLELMLCKVRREPLSVHLKWLGETGKGREMVFVQGQHSDKLHIRMGQSDLFAGRRLAFAPDSPLVRGQSRYAITEMNLHTNVRRFVNVVDAIERKQINSGTLRYVGVQLRPEFPKPIEVVEHQMPAAFDPNLPRGGTRFFGFDESGLLMLMTALDENRHEVEYYCIDRLQGPLQLDNADFDPDQVLGSK